MGSRNLFSASIFSCKRGNLFTSFNDSFKAYSHYLPNVFSRGAKTSSKLPVVLATYVDTLGNPGDVVKVNPGFCRNYLLPNLIALPAIKKHLDYMDANKGAIMERLKDELKEEKIEVKTSDDERKKDLDKIYQFLDKSTLSIKRDTSRRSNVLTQQVTVKDIIFEVKKQLSIDLSEHNLVLSKPITEVGEVEVPLRLPKVVPLPRGLEFLSLKVKVRRK